jgi:hypothetical protein
VLGEVGAVVSVASGEDGADGAAGAAGEGEDGEAALAAAAGAEEPSPLVVFAGAVVATVVAGAAGVPVGLSDAFPSPPPRAMAGVPGGAFGLEPPATASEPMPPGPIDSDGAAGVPVGLSDALPGPPPRATAGPASDAVETFPIAPRAGPKSAGLGVPPATAAPPTPGALPVLAEVAVELPEPRVVFVGPNRLDVSVPMLPRAAAAACDPASSCANVVKLGPGAPSGETATWPVGAAP